MQLLRESEERRVVAQIEFLQRGEVAYCTGEVLNASTEAIECLECREIPYLRREHSEGSILVEVECGEGAEVAYCGR